jgi:two-component system NtrC family sensor kinase
MLQGGDLHVASLPISECVCPWKEGPLGDGVEEVTVVPLSAEDRALGFLHLAWTGSAADVDRTLLAAAGRAVGLSLRNSQLYEEARRVPGLRSVNRIAAAAISAVNEDVVLRRILEMTCQALDAAAGAVILRDTATGEMRLAMGVSDHGGQVQGMRFEAGRGVAGWTLESGEAACLEAGEGDRRFLEEPVAALVPEVASLMCAPMRDIVESVGVIEILNKRHGPFDEHDVSLLESVASITVVALKNARMYRDLAALVSEQRSMQARLIHAEKMSALGRLTASLAHEINNPLQAVQGYLSLVREQWDEPRRKERLRGYLGIAAEEVERIADLLSRMRDFYRRAPEAFGAVDVQAELERVLEITRNKLELGKVRVERDWAAGGEGLTVEGNADQLRQVFLNLVLNAADAMPDGGKLHISTGVEDRWDDGVPRARIAFADSGSGMAPEVQERLFEPFFTTKDEGSGLGLSISYGIVRAHGGEVVVTSNPGRGSTFTVWLPVEQAPGGGVGRGG